ncbi:MAG: DNA polymerase III subunit gamma/tau domain-containing protein [Chloroflexota bacterium]
MQGERRQSNEFELAAGHDLAWRGDWQGALAAYRHAVGVQPQDPVARAFLALALARLSQLPQSLHELQTALAGEPRNTVLLSKTAELQVRVGDPSAAARTYTTLSEVLQRNGYREAANTAAAQARELLAPPTVPESAPPPTAETPAAAAPAGTTVEETVAESTVLLPSTAEPVSSSATQAATNTEPAPTELLFTTEAPPSETAAAPLLPTAGSVIEPEIVLPTVEETDRVTVADGFFSLEVAQLNAVASQAVLGETSALEGEQSETDWQAPGEPALEAATAEVVALDAAEPLPPQLEERAHDWLAPTPFAEEEQDAVAEEPSTVEEAGAAPVEALAPAAPESQTETAPLVIDPEPPQETPATHGTAPIVESQEGNHRWGWWPFKRHEPAVAETPQTELEPEEVAATVVAAEAVAELDAVLPETQPATIDEPETALSAAEPLHAAAGEARADELWVPTTEVLDAPAAQAVPAIAWTTDEVLAPPWAADEPAKAEALPETEAATGAGGAERIAPADSSELLAQEPAGQPSAEQNEDKVASPLEPPAAAGDETWPQVLEVQEVVALQPADDGNLAVALPTPGEETATEAAESQPAQAAEGGSEAAAARVADTSPSDEWSEVLTILAAGRWEEARARQASISRDLMDRIQESNGALVELTRLPGIDEWAAREVLSLPRQRQTPLLLALLRGRAFQESGLANAAAEELEGAISAFPDLLAPQVALGRLYEASGRRAAAAAKYDILAELCEASGEDKLYIEMRARAEANH